MKQPESLESVMRDLLGGLGLPDPRMVEALRAEWDELAGDPWSGQSRPAYLRQRELVVSASAPSLVSLLRYATGDLLRRLDARLGEGVVDSVRIVTG